MSTSTVARALLLPITFGSLLKRVGLTWLGLKLWSMAFSAGMLDFFRILQVDLLDRRWMAAGVLAPMLVGAVAILGIKAARRTNPTVAELLLWLAGVSGALLVVAILTATWQNHGRGEVWILFTALGSLYLMVIGAKAVVRWAMQEHRQQYPQQSVSQDLNVPSDDASTQRADTGGFVSRPKPVVPPINLQSIAGMADLKRDLAEFIDPFRSLRAAKTVPDRNGLLLSGPPGNGKTLVATAIAGELGLPLLSFGVEDIASKWMGEGQLKIKALFELAKASAPCVLFLDEFDAIAPRRDSAHLHDETSKDVNALLAGIGALRAHKVVLIAATNFYAKLDAAVIRDGRFDFRIEIPLPDRAARGAIISGLTRKYGLKIDSGVQGALAEHWVERSASFMEGALKRVRDDTKSSGGWISLEAVKSAGRKSSRLETAIPRDCASTSDMFLTPEVRRDVDGLLYRMKNWESVVAQGGSAPKGVLLYGPPGTGKTSLARAMTKTLGDWHMFEVKTAEILADPRLFNDVIDKARQHRPAVIFIDEADDLLRDRNHSNSATTTNEILKSMDGMMGSIPEVVFIAATNNVEVIDAAALRGGRFADRIYLGLFQGGELARYVQVVIDKQRNLNLAPLVSAAAIADLIGEAGPADVNEIMSKAVNYTLTDRLGDGRQRLVTLGDVERAVLAMRR